MTHQSITIETPSLPCGLCREAYVYGDANFYNNPPATLILVLVPNSRGMNHEAVYRHSSSPNQDIDLEERATDAGWKKVPATKGGGSLMVCPTCQEVAKALQKAEDAE
jgi:hypothetical protein